TIRGQQVKLIGEISGQETQDRFKEELQSMLNKNQNAVKKITDAHDLIINKNQENIKTKTELLNKTNSELAILRANITNYEAIVAMADETGDGSARDNPGAKFFSGWEATFSNAAAMFTACCKETNKTENASSCKQAKHIICSDPDSTHKSTVGDCESESKASSRKERFLEINNPGSGSTK
ncbi:MAG: hypothetical protein ABL927_10570, partial [Bdellovibrionales bacterium]